MSGNRVGINRVCPLENAGKVTGEGMNIWRVELFAKGRVTFMTVVRVTLFLPSAYEAKRATGKVVFHCNFCGVLVYY